MQPTFAFARHLMPLAEQGLPEDWRMLAARILGACQAIRQEDETDAQRAGEALSAFCYPLIEADGSTRWLLRIVGAESGEEYAELGFITALAGADEWPLELLAPAMTMALNGGAQQEQLSAFRELVQMAQRFEDDARS